MKLYDPTGCYWSGAPGVFCGASRSLVAATDAAYVAWLAAGNLPKAWPKDASGAQTIAALDAALAPYGLTSGLAAPTPAQLLAYAETVRANIAAGGISVNIAAAGAPAQLVEIGTDAGGLAVLAIAVQLTSTAPGTSYDWDQAEPVTLTGSQILAIQAAVGLFGQQCFTAKTAVRAAINAGAITTTAQIDAFAWPLNS